MPREWKCDGADKRASVDRRLLCLDGGPPRLSWSRGKLVSREAHGKLIAVALCGRHAGLHCEPGECAFSHMFWTRETQKKGTLRGIRFSVCSLREKQLGVFRLGYIMCNT